MRLPEQTILGAARAQWIENGSSRCVCFLLITFVERVLECPVDIPQRCKSFVMKKFVDSLIAMSEGMRRRLSF